MSGRWRIRLYAVVLACLAAYGIHRSTAAHPNWSFDGYTYAIRMQMDAGIPYAQARTSAQMFYSDKPPAGDPETAPYLATPYPQYWALFAPRILYSYAASLLWRAQGMQALLTVSNVAFVAAVLALFLMLARFAAAEVAALLAVAFASIPQVQMLGRSSLTDMAALALWIGTLWTMCEYARSGSRSGFAAYVLLSACMTFTRPIPYIPLCASLALIVLGAFTREKRLIRAGTAMASVALALCAAVEFAGASAGSPGLLEIVRGLRVGSHHLAHAPLAVWYAARVVAVLFAAAAAFFELLAPPLAAFYLWRHRLEPVAALCIGSAASLFLTALVDPIVGDVWRVIVVPLLPVVCIASAMAFGLQPAARPLTDSDAYAA